MTYTIARIEPAYFLIGWQQEVSEKSERHMKEINSPGQTDKEDGSKWVPAEWWRKQRHLTNRMRMFVKFMLKITLGWSWGVKQQNRCDIRLTHNTSHLFKFIYTVMRKKFHGRVPSATSACMKGWRRALPIFIALRTVRPNTTVSSARKTLHDPAKSDHPNTYPLDENCRHPRHLR